MARDKDLPIADYARPSAEESTATILLRIARQVIFAIGIWLILYGIGYGLARWSGTYSMAECVAWGGALVALVMPLPRWR